MNSKINKNLVEKDKKESNLKQKKFPLPALMTIFPINYNPIHDTLLDKIKQWEDWMQEISGISIDIYDKITRCTTQFASYFFPFCTDIERYESCVKCLLLGFVWDDQTELKTGDIGRNLQHCYQYWGQFHQCLDKLLNKKFIPTDNWKPYVFATYAVLERFVKDYNMEQKKHFLESWRLYAIGSCKETEVICENYSLENMDEWLAIRRYSVGADFVFQVILYTYEITLTDEEWKCPKYQLLLNLVTKTLTLTNDFFSFEKEFKEQGGDIEKMFNIVGFISKWDGIALTDSLVNVAQLIRDTEMQIICLENELLNDSNISEMKKLFIIRINDAIGGNYAISKTIKRYQNF